jgi:hypothetical protein
MGARIDIGVDAHGDGGRGAHGPGDMREALELGFAFDVEALDAGIEALAHLVGGLGDAGEDDPFGRDADGKRPP